MWLMYWLRSRSSNVQTNHLCKHNQWQKVDLILLLKKIRSTKLNFLYIFIRKKKENWLINSERGFFYIVFGWKFIKDGDYICNSYVVTGASTFISLSLCWRADDEARVPYTFVCFGMCWYSCYYWFLLRAVIGADVEAEPKWWWNGRTITSRIRQHRIWKD